MQMILWSVLGLALWIFKKITNIGNFEWKTTLTLKLFNPLSTSSTRAFGSLFCVATRHLYLVSSPGGWVLCSPLALWCIFLQTFYQYGWNIWFNLWIKMWIWFWSVKIPTNCNYLCLANWPKGCIVNVKFSLLDHRAVVDLKKMHIHHHATEYKHTEDYLKRKTIEKYVRCFVNWPPCS